MEFKPIYRYIYLGKDFKLNPSGQTRIEALDNVFKKVKSIPDDFNPQMDLFLETNPDNQIQYIQPFCQVTDERVQYIDLYWK